MKIETISIKEIKLNPDNPRVITDQKFQALVKSCIVCGSDFRIKMSHFERRKTCSMVCRGKLNTLEQSGQNHPGFKNGLAMRQTYNCRNCQNDFISDKGHTGRVPEFCSKKCFGANLFIKRPEKRCLECGHIFKVKDLHKKNIFCSIKCLTKNINDRQRGVKKPHKCGENSSQWKGGLTSINGLIRASMEYKQWRTKVFIRDNRTCVKCGYSGKDINADHIKPFSMFSELRLDINNGRTLCFDCHKKTPTYGRNNYVKAS